MEAPKKLVALLELLNAFGTFIQLPEVPELMQPGYAEYLRHLRYTNGVPKSDLAIRLVDKFLRSSHLGNEFIEFKMRWLEKVLCLMPEPLALDILRQSPNFNYVGADKILFSLKDTRNWIFEPDIDEEDAVMDFHHCISRYQELSLVQNFLSELLIARDKYQTRAKDYFQTEEFRETYFQLLKMPEEANPYIRVGINSEFKIVFYLNESFRILNEADITRIRICERCEKFFWAGRKDAVGCPDCAATLRKKRWRDKYNEKKAERQKTPDFW